MSAGKKQDFHTINDDLARFAKCIPADGMHISYLDKACELMDLYGEALSIMEDERIIANEERVEEIAREIREIVGK